jgi:vacuolar-type H+-ATPase subunit E/Vma4
VSTFWDVSGGVKLSFHAGAWTIDAKVDAFLYRFLDFARLDGRNAIVADVGVGLAW